ATHRNLEESVKDGIFREDLWFRINVFPIRLPALRDRIEDIADLAEYFAQKASNKLGLPLALPTESQISYMKKYEWPGNVRELQVIIERAAILGQGAFLAIEESLVLPQASIDNNGKVANQVREPIRTNGVFLTLNEALKLHITKALVHCHGRVE